MPGGAAHQMPRMPSPWWSSTNIAIVFLPRTNQAGLPCDGRSVTSGSASQMRRSSFNATERPVPMWLGLLEHRVVVLGERLVGLRDRRLDGFLGIGGLEGHAVERRAHRRAGLVHRADDR